MLTVRKVYFAGAKRQGIGGQLSREGGWRLVTLRLYSILEPSAVSTVQFDGGAGGGGAWKRTHRQFASDKRLARSVASSVACQLLKPFKVPGYPPGTLVLIYLAIY